MNKEEITHNLLPHEFLSGEIRAELLGNRELWVENYRGIMSISEECICLKGNHYGLKIEGKELCIFHFNGEDMRICGWIRQISFWT